MSALAFLSTKSWNPRNVSNQKELYNAEERDKARIASELKKALEIKKKEN